jgi:hypothetical protein
MQFMKRSELQELSDPAQAEYLADIMSRMWMKSPNTPFPSILNAVMDADRKDGLEELVELYGLR